MSQVEATMGTKVAKVEEGGHAVQAPEDVNGLVRLAIEQKVPVEVLERLVALQERVTERNARAEFFAALARFHETCPPIIKTRENTQFQVSRGGVKRAARYAALEEIDRVARPVATECGLAWTWDTKVEGDVMHVTCRVLHVMGHSECSTVTMPHGSNAGSSPQQKYGSTQTYGMRYSLVAALGITTADEDTDGRGSEEAGEPVSEFQAKDIRDRLTKAARDEAGFCKWAGVERLENLPAARYDEACKMIATVAKQAAKKEAAAS